MVEATPTASPASERAREGLSHHEQMKDAEAGCLPCKLCGGKAIISDGGSGAGYYISCSGSKSFRAGDGCLIDGRRLMGWAYNVMDWWNRLHKEDERRILADQASVGEVERVRAIVAWLRSSVGAEATRMMLAAAMPGGTRAEATKRRAFAEGCAHGVSSVIDAIERGEPFRRDA